MRTSIAIATELRGQEGGRLDTSQVQVGRREEGTRICAHLTTAIGETAPPGVGSRNDVWEAVGPPTSDFMASLRTWERTGTEADKQRVRDTYRTVLAAWRAALKDGER